MVILTIKNLGDIKLEMDYKNAPISAKNFVGLVKKGFYDGLIFHRVIKGFMIQGGDPTGTGMGGPGYGIKGEFAANGVKNNLSHKRGVISMARSQHPDSAGSQFFICDADDEFLDGNYAAFGKVIEGMEVVDKIAAVKKNRMDRPLENIVIEKAVAIDEPEA
ncbi:MAG: peptidylprolyl isomerase [Erysipelotrichaceae bacterium]|jgi:peptidyl-prolyl cis-trans isomerase B (cyclophilin B)|nr:peptidylprolyl isomerase [Erysipelotrichaceae bacterium]